MPIITLCPGCEQKFHVETDLIGRKVTCRRCETLFAVNEGVGLRVENGNIVKQSKVSKSESESIDGESFSSSNGSFPSELSKHRHHDDNTSSAVQKIAMFYFHETPRIIRYLGDFIYSLFDDADQPCELKIPPDIDHKQVQYLGIKGWKIELPPHCIVCGKKTKRVFHIEEQIFSLGSPLLVISIGFAMTLLLWGNQVGWLIILPSVLPWLALGYYISRKIPVELAYSRCKNHAESAVSPQLRIFERGLIIEVEHRRIRREFFRPEEFDFNTVNDSLLRNTAAERRETWHDASENGESEFEIQQALSSGVFLEKVATTDGSTQYQQTPIQVHNGQCPQCDHQIKTNINQCPKCDMSFIIGSCNVCGNSCSIDTPCKCGASLIVSCESTQNQFCRGCGSNWDGTTKYSWPSTSKKVSYCPRCLIDQRAQIKVPIGIKNPDHYRLAAFDRKISKAKLAAKNEHKAEISERHSHFFRGLIGAAVGGDAAWGYAAAGNSKNMPHKDRMELASLQRIRRLYLLQTDLKYATKWERREIEWGVYIRKALLWSVVISVTLIVILIAALVIFSATNSVE